MTELFQDFFVVKTVTMVSIRLIINVFNALMDAIIVKINKNVKNANLSTFWMMVSVLILAKKISTLKINSAIIVLKIVVNANQINL